MARFIFTLQTVLEQREHEERLAQLALAEAQLVLVQLEERLAKLDAEVNDANRELREQHLMGPVKVDFISAHRRYLATMKLNVIQLVQSMADARLEIEQRQRKLATAVQHRKAIELLRDRQKARWQADQDKRELDLLDEAAMQIAFDDLALARRTA
jgi:flagellar export protein FliJ